MPNNLRAPIRRPSSQGRRTATTALLNASRMPGPERRKPAIFQLLAWQRPEDAGDALRKVAGGDGFPAAGQGWHLDVPPGPSARLQFRCDPEGRLWHGIGRMKRRIRLIAPFVLAACTVLAAVPPPAQKPRFPRTFADVGITLLDEWAADLDLSADGKRLLYARRDPRDWYFDLWLARPSGREQECVGCGLPDPSKHRGGPSWHPAGEFLAFSAENSDVRTRRADRLAEPGTALNTNLWVMSADGSKAWQLTDYETDYKEPRGVLGPAFSPDGTRIAWTGPVNRSPAGPGYEWGEWAIFLADFVVEDGVPTLRNTRQLQPGAQHGFYQVDDWSP
ncbi:MAG: hypothetical protein EHM24_22830, partial [Acidobacteria bacterium]